MINVDLFHISGKTTKKLMEENGFTLVKSRRGKNKVKISKNPITEQFPELSEEEIEDYIR